MSDLRWDHQPGDSYRVAVGLSGVTWTVSAQEHDTLIGAICEGFTEWDRSDDFNIVAYRDGAPTARLWMDEVLDSPPGPELLNAWWAVSPAGQEAGDG